MTLTYEANVIFHAWIQQKQKWLKNTNQKHYFGRRNTNRFDLSKLSVDVSHYGTSVFSHSGGVKRLQILVHTM